ncbi:MAG: porphobilinogen synthase [Candidatus Dormibacteraeota bacterium]|nr:porphobilinogen synthase [Candidatus Dormibacteraeota bacterium]
MTFPIERPRRLRSRPALRRLARETRLGPENLIYPLFVREDIEEAAPLDAMPGIYQHTLDSLTREAEAAIGVGVRSFVLFGIPARKDAQGSAAWDDNGIVQRALRGLRDAFGPEVLLIADLCLCEYTDHGHCGVLDGESVANDPTLALYQRIARAQAGAGADVIAPSGMMDGQVRAIRAALDEGGFDDRAILAYSAKYASALYGPFREAAGSSPRLGDRRGYQMDPGNAREAVREARLDIAEGADIVMVKPALSCLDVIRAVAESTDVPVAAYNVSGEYAMVKAAAANGWIDERRVIREVLLGIRRAGAHMILTYHAREAAKEMPCWEELG